VSNVEQSNHGRQNYYQPQNGWGSYYLSFPGIMANGTSLDGRVVSPIDRGTSMKLPYALKIIDSCATCPIREQHLFCNLSPSAAQRLNEITSPAVYPRAATLFIEGQQGRGVFVLCSGKAKLSSTSREGKTIITKISEHGDVLGLNATISNRPYEVTAEMLQPGQANFIAADTFLQFLRDYGEVATRVAQELSRNYYSAHEGIRTLGLVNSPGKRLAKLLLGWSAEHGDSNHARKLHLVLTHEEIADMIGSRRETVSRLFSAFKKKRFIRSQGVSLVILNRSALEGMVQDLNSSGVSGAHNTKGIESRLSIDSAL
jgi:CRP/FNR family cyclic AMP-dependent transcriptional regulator